MSSGLSHGLLSSSVASWVGQSYRVLKAEHIVRTRVLLPSDGQTDGQREGRRGKENDNLVAKSDGKSVC